MIFDTHAHYDDRAYDDDREVVLSANEAAGIARVVNVAASMQSCITTLDLAKNNPNIYAAVGVHPSDTLPLTDEDMKLLEEYCKEDKVVAVGEIGLDYYWDEPDRDIQKKWFVRQLELARRVSLPVIIHSRDAAADTLDIMKNHNAGEIGGVIHCFSYGVEMAREYLDMGFFLGVGGVVTFKNGRKLKEVVEYAPLESIVTETDSPYLAPVPHRGARNTSANIPLVIEEIANIKGLPYEKVEEVLWDNALRLYRQK